MSYWLPIVLTFAFIVFKLRYAVIVYDDVLDLITDKYTFTHGRYFLEIIALLLVNGIPKMLGINMQDFAFISQDLVKSVIFVIFSIVVANSFYIFRKKNLLLYPLLYFYTFLFLYTSIVKENIFVLYTLQHYFGYIVPLLLFLITWYKISDIYVNEKTADSFDVKLLIFLSFLLAQSNELIFVVMFLMFTFLGVEKLIEYKKHKTVENYKWILQPFLALLLVGEIIYTSAGSIDIFNRYKTTETFVVEIQNLFIYLQTFFEKFIFNNLLFIIPIVFMFFILRNLSNDKERNKRVCRYLVYTWVSI